MQGWEFAHLLLCSDCSNQMSNCEQFAQIAQNKWATIRESLRSLMINHKWANEQITRFFWANHSLIFCLQKTSILLKKIDWNCIFWYVFICLNKKTRVICSFPLFSWAMWANCSGHSQKLRDCERIAQVAQVALDKWATLSESLRSLMTNQWPWVIHSGAHDKWFAQQFLAKKI